MLPGLNKTQTDGQKPHQCQKHQQRDQRQQGA